MVATRRRRKSYSEDMTSQSNLLRCVDVVRGVWVGREWRLFRQVRGFVPRREGGTWNFGGCSEAWRKTSAERRLALAGTPVIPETCRGQSKTEQRAETQVQVYSTSPALMGTQANREMWSWPQDAAV